MQYFFDKLKELAFEYPGYLALALSIVGSLLAIAPFLLWPQVPAFLMISAESTIVQYNVARPTIAEIPLINAKVNGPKKKCQSGYKSDGDSVFGIIAPPKQASVIYRWSNQTIVIQVKIRNDVPIKLVLSEGAICEFTGYVNIRMRASVVKSLPIAGPASTGLEIGQPVTPTADAPYRSELMYGATIRVFGRTVFGALYPAQINPVLLPAGGRLSSLSGSTGSKNTTEPVPWYGVAIIGKRAFEISITTKATKLRFFRPGNPQNIPEDLSLFTGLLNDPSIALFSLAALAFAVLMQAVTGWIGIWKINNSNKNSATITSVADSKTLSESKAPEIKIPNQVEEESDIREGDEVTETAKGKADEQT